MKIFNNPRTAFFNEANVIDILLTKSFKNRLEDFDVRAAMPTVVELLYAFRETAREVEENMTQLLNPDSPTSLDELTIAKHIAENAAIYHTLAMVGLGFSEFNEVNPPEQNGATTYLYALKALLNFSEAIGLREPVENKHERTDAVELDTFCEALLPHLPARTAAYMQHRRAQIGKHL